MLDVSWRPLTTGDLPALAGWLAEPGVARWWREPSDLATVRAKYEPRALAAERTEVFVVLVDDVAAGIVQRYRTADDDEWRDVLHAADPTIAALASAGVDYLIGRPELRGRGVGTALLSAFTERLLVEWPDVEAVVTSVLAENVASWRALEKAGYVREWSGQLASDDPSDQGESYLLVRRRWSQPTVRAYASPSRSKPRRS